MKDTQPRKSSLKRRKSNLSGTNNGNSDSAAGPALAYDPAQFLEHGVDQRTPTATTYRVPVSKSSSDPPNATPNVTKHPFTGFHAPTRAVEPSTAGESLPLASGDPFADANANASSSPEISPGQYRRAPYSTHQYGLARSTSSSASRLENSPPRPHGLWDSDLTLNQPIMPRHSGEQSRENENRQSRASFLSLGEGSQQRFNGVEEREGRTVKMQLPHDNDFMLKDPHPSRNRPDHRRAESDWTIHSSGYTSPSGTDYEVSSDEYDWSGEEDLAEEASKYESMMGKKQKKKGWGPKRLVSLMFSSLIGSIITAGLVATPAIVVHIYWYKANPSDHRKYVSQNVSAWLYWAASNIVVSWQLAMILDVIPVLVRYSLEVIWGHVSEAVKSNLEMYEAVKGTIKPAFYAGAWLASWVIIFHHIYGLYNPEASETSRAAYLDRVYQVVMFFFFLVIVLCVQKMLSHFVAFNFHRTAYKDRIEEVDSRLSVIEQLQKYQPSRRHYPNRSGARTPVNPLNRLSAQYPYDMHTVTARLNALEGNLPLSRLSSGMTIPVSRYHEGLGEEALDKTPVADNWVDGGEGMKSKKKAPWFRFRKDKDKAPAPIGMEEINKASVEVDIHPASTSNSPRQSQDDWVYIPRDVNEKQHKKAQSESGGGGNIAIKAAKVLKNAILHDARNISGQDEDFSTLVWNVNSSVEAKRLARTLFKRLKDRRRKYLIASDFHPAFPTQREAEEAFEVFDIDNNGDLSRAEFKRTLVKTYRERRFLSRSLKDAGEALASLDRILLAFAMIILFFISLSVFGVEVGDSLTSVYSIGIAASFIFKNAASSAFDAIMFLFVTHPYDTGDRVFVDNDNLVVKKMGLFATIFERSDGTQTYYFNSQLFTKFITNARRSGKTTEQLRMQISWKTPLTRLDALEKALNEWLSTEEHRWYQPQTGVTLQHIVYQRYLELTIGIGHNGNWQDWGLRNQRKTAFHAAVQYYCRQLGIVGYESPLPIVFSEPNVNTSEPTSMDHRASGAGADDPRVSMAGLKVEEIEEIAKKEKPCMGFLPPLPERSSHIMRARKSHRSRKEKLGAMNAEC